MVIHGRSKPARHAIENRVALEETVSVESSIHDGPRTDAAGPGRRPQARLDPCIGNVRDPPSRISGNGAPYLHVRPAASVRASVSPRLAEGARGSRESFTALARKGVRE
jgi:hypothetical protein